MRPGLPVLGPGFKPRAAYAAATPGYDLLPLRFSRLDGTRYVATNLVGEHVVMSRRALARLVRHELRGDEDVYNELKSKHFLVDGESTVALDLLATKYRTKQSRLADFTSLFMFVTTLRCEHTCTYCQVSRQTEDKTSYDMSPATVDLAVDFMFRSPSPHLKVEFQGGEPLLAFERIQQVVTRVEERNRTEQRDVVFVIASNLAALTDEHLAFCNEHNVAISTSLDGPEDLHNANRHRRDGDSYARAVAGIRRVREALGHDRVSALMTTTEASLSMPERIVDEYVALGFDSVFLRPLSPYGFARRGRDPYQVDRWLAFYESGLDHITKLNAEGTFIREAYTSIILRKVLTPFPTGYVDLQSPAGIGIAGIVFNYDGSVYASDEGRMLAEMGDQTFRLGALGEDSYEDIMASDALLEPLLDSMTEGVPMCSDCAFQPYCGSDPVYHHAVQGDVVGFKPTSDFCRRNMGVMRSLIRRLEDDPVARRVFWSWVSPC